MERSIFTDAARIPASLPVIDVPTPEGFVWIELTPAEYAAAVADPQLAVNLVTHVRAVLVARLAQAVAQESTSA